MRPGPGIKAVSFRCCSRLSCISGQLVGRGGGGWIVLLVFRIGGWHGDSVGVFICLDCCSSNLTVPTSPSGDWEVKGQDTGRGSLGRSPFWALPPCCVFMWQGSRVSVALVPPMGIPPWPHVNVVTS